jgi:GDPmannose 4,6-dehydratase
VNILLGDAKKAVNKLGWRVTTTFRDLVHEMVDADCRALGIAQPATLAASAK